MLVPVPRRGQFLPRGRSPRPEGLLVAFDPRQDLPRRPHGGSSQLLWSDGDRVYALVGTGVSDVLLVEMANAVQ
jgi:hypothetical protein